MFNLVDNATAKHSSNKMVKVAPLYNSLSNALSKFGIFHEYLSVDKSMVPYFFWHSCKMFIRGKPVRFGSSSSYELFCCELYAGRCIYRPHCVSAQARLASHQLDWGVHDG